MAYKQALQIAALLAVQTSSANEPIAITGDYVVPAGLVIGDIVEMAPLPSGYVVADVTLAAEDCDSATGMTIDAGVLSGDFGVVDNARTMGSEFFAASTIGQAGGVARASKQQGFLIAPTENTRGLGIKFAAIGTPIVGAKLRFIAWVRPALNGV